MTTLRLVMGELDSHPHAATTVRPRSHVDRLRAASALPLVVTLALSVLVRGVQVPGTGTVPSRSRRQRSSPPTTGSDPTGRPEIHQHQPIGGTMKKLLTIIAATVAIGIAAPTANAATYAEIGGHAGIANATKAGATYLIASDANVVKATAQVVCANGSYQTMRYNAWVGGGATWVFDGIALCGPLGARMWYLAWTEQGERYGHSLRRYV